MKIVYFSLLGNYQETLNDSTAAVTLKPTFIKAIERGEFLTINFADLYIVHEVAENRRV